MTVPRLLPEHHKDPEDMPSVCLQTFSYIWPLLLNVKTHSLAVFTE